MEGTATPGSRPDSVPRNRLLDSLESATCRRISPYLQPVTLGRGAVVFEAGGALDYAYFPTGCVLSLQTVLENGAAIETANIGVEGAFGLSAIMSSRISFVRGVIRLQGPLIRCSLDALRGEMANQVVRHFSAVNSESILTQVQQNVVCNARHSTTERLCRWLLTMQDRAGGESVAYPRAFLAEVLGETHGSVACAAESMQTAGLVTCRRGTIQLIDRPRLEQASCVCYAIVKERYDDLFQTH